MPAQNTLREVKQRLAAAFPDVDFIYGVDGRGRLRGHGISWHGGPTAFDVRLAAMPLPWRTNYHFNRIMTPDEYAAWSAEQDANYEVWLAGEPERKAQRKAAGIAKRKATVERKRYCDMQLAAAFPNIAFRIEVDAVHWCDGPDATAVAEVLGIPEWKCHRQESLEGRLAAEAIKRQAIQAERLQRRLGASKAKHARVQAAIARDAARADQATRQFVLPF
jgi:hypothetical protein